MPGKNRTSQNKPNNGSSSAKRDEIDENLSSQNVGGGMSRPERTVADDAADEAVNSPTQLSDRKGRGGVAGPKGSGTGRSDRDGGGIDAPNSYQPESGTEHEPIRKDVNEKRTPKGENL